MFPRRESWDDKSKLCSEILRSLNVQRKIPHRRVLSMKFESRLLTILKEFRLLSMLKEFRLLLLRINIDLFFFLHFLNVFNHLLIFLLRCIDQAEGSEYQVDSAVEKLFHSKRHFVFHFQLKFSRTLFTKLSEQLPQNLQMS
jgi:hypothetical protein